MFIGSEEDYQKYEQLKLNTRFEAKEGEISSENLEAQQMEEMDFQEEEFNPYGLGLVGPWARRYTGKDSCLLLPARERMKARPHTLRALSIPLCPLSL